MRIEHGEVAQQQDVIAIKLHRFCTSGINDHRAVMARLLLQTRMAVIPIGPRLADGELVGEGLARFDTGKADAGHPIHVKRQKEAVPVDRCVRLKVIGDIKADILPFAQPDQRAGHTAVDRDARAAPPFDNAVAAANGQVDDIA